MVDDAVKVAVIPGHIPPPPADEVIVIIGNWFNVTVCMAVFTQPFASVPVTVYIVLAVGVCGAPSVMPPVQV